MNEELYQSPALVVVELHAEGVLCFSSQTEFLNEDEGVW